MRHLLYCLFFFGSVTAFTQAPPAKDAKDAQPAPYTEVEALKVQNVTLERVIVQRAVDDWQKHLAAVKADLEKAREGWIWNPDDGSWKKAPEPPSNGSGK